MDYVAIASEIIDFINNNFIWSFSKLVDYVIENNKTDWLEVLLNKTEFFVAYYNDIKEINED